MIAPGHGFVCAAVSAVHGESPGHPGDPRRIPARPRKRAPGRDLPNARANIFHAMCSVYAGSQTGRL